MTASSPSTRTRGLVLTAISIVGVAVLAAVAWFSFLPNEVTSSLPAPKPTLRQMTQSQYVNSISRIFGADVAVKIRYAPVNRTDGLLAVGAGNVVMTMGAFEPLVATARAVAEQVVEPVRRPFLIPCVPANAKAADAKCARAFLTEVGRLLYRRPLTEAEATRVVSTANNAAGKAGDFYAGLAYALSEMLVSPQFLYIWETVDPASTGSGAQQLDAYSKASRLSFLLWDAGPDDKLLQAAAHGDLNNPAGLRRQVDRMLNSPNYTQGVRAFFSDFFVLEAFDTLSKDATIYPGFSLKAVDEAREQVLRTAVDHLVARQGDYRDLYTTQHTFLTSDLAVLYGLVVDVGSQGWVPYDADDGDQRTGLLTQIGFLAQYAHPGRSSPTKRGRAIREVLLCQKVPDPPPNVDFTKFENPANPSPTARERLAAHQENPVCAGCHHITDPIGVSLENFDGAGQFRTTERGAKIDASGELDGVAFADAVGLGKAVRDSPSLKSCIVDRLFAYSVGRPVAPDEKPRLEEYKSVLDKKGYRFDEMLRLVVLDKSFFVVRPPQVAEATPINTASKGGSNAH